MVVLLVIAPSSITVEPTWSLAVPALDSAVALSVVAAAVDSLRALMTPRVVVPDSWVALTLTGPALPVEAPAPTWSVWHLCWSGLVVGWPASTTLSGRVQQVNRSALVAAPA